MKKFLFLFIFVANFAQAYAPTPCYWQGSSTLCLPSQGIFLDNNKTVRYGEATTNGVNYVEVIAPASLGSNFVMTLPAATDTFVGKATTDILTNKTLSGNTATNLISGTGTFTFNTSGTITAPNATDTLVGKATTDILTNKTLTGNTAVNLISGSGTFVHNTTGTITAPNATDTLVGKATTDILTNKSMSGSTNTFTNLPASGITGTVPLVNGGTGTAAASANEAFNALSPMSSAGDIIYGGTAGAATAIHNGTSVQVLHSGTTPSWSAVSLSADTTGTLTLAKGGTNAGLTASAGAIPYSTASAMAFNTPGTGSDWCLSGGTGAPTFSSSTTSAKTFDGGATVGTTTPILTISAGASSGSSLTWSQNSAARWSLFTNDLGPNGTGSSANTLNFYQQNASRYDGSITSTGAWLIGNATAAVAHQIQSANASGGILFVQGQGTNDEAAYFGVGKHSATTTTSQIFIRFGTNGFTDAGGIRANSGTPQFFAASDRRIKQDIVPLEPSLTKIMALNPVTYRYKADPKAEKVPGFIAQEFAEVFPSQVTKTDNGKGDKLPSGVKPWTMSKDDLSIYLVKAVQELKLQLDDANKEIARLKADKR